MHRTAATVERAIPVRGRPGTALPGTRAARPVRDDRRCPRVSVLRYSFPLCFIPEFADGDAPRAPGNTERV